MSIFDDFTRCYALSKTLQFKLIPQGATVDNIKRFGILEDDECRAKSYQSVKAELDKYHRSHINNRLACLSLDWSGLYAAYIERRHSDEQQKKYIALAAAQAFFGKFKDIGYNAENDWFEFAFDYSDFGINGGEVGRVWTACTCGNGRSDVKKDEYGRFTHVSVDVTQQLKSLFDKFGIVYDGDGLKERIVAQSEKDFFVSLMYLLGLTLKLRYEDNAHDFILSPIVKNGKFFDSRDHENVENATLPIDGDVNGAYHIALQGVRLLTAAKDGKLVRDKKGEQRSNWLTFAQRIAQDKFCSHE